MKTNIKKLILFVFVGLTLTSCGDFGDTNLDPTRPGGENVSLVAITPTMQTQSHRNIGASIARLAGIVTQQLEGFDAQQVAFTQYAIDEGTIGNLWEFGLYTGSMRDCVDMIERAKRDGLPHTEGIAKIYLAVNLGIATNIWGDVPYSQAFQADQNLTPTYDSQENVYTTIQSLLDEAIVNLSAADPKGILGNLISSDWVKTAHALKARYYLQLTKRDPNAAQKALAEVGKTFGSNKEAPVFKWENTLNGGNPLAKFGLERPNTMVIAPYFATLMEGDPRKAKYMVNKNDTELFFEADNNNLFWAQLNSPSPLISYWEVKFIEAEAKQRLGQDAKATLVEAIKANMSYMSIPAGDINAYTGAISTADLKTIMMEKYKASYGNDFLGVWNDYRRTGFPELTPNAEGKNGSNPTGVIPRRFLYPRSERLGNNENYTKAISNQGGHLQDVDLWAFK